MPHEDLRRARNELGLTHLRYAFPSKPLFRISLGIDATLFSRQPVKRRCLAFMPRRLPDDLLQVINILKFRGVLDDVELAPIDKMNEAQVAAAMKDHGARGGPLVGRGSEVDLPGHRD